MILFTKSQLILFSVEIYCYCHCHEGSSYITHVYNTTTIAPSTTETTITSHDMILSPKTYNVYDQYNVYVNIPLTPPPPHGVPVVIVATIVAVVAVDDEKVTDKRERDWCDLSHYFEHTFIYMMYMLHVKYMLYIMYLSHTVYMFPIIVMVNICHL